MENKYPEDIMEILRQRLGLEEDDTSRDSEINTYTPSEAFEEVCNWEGFLGYASTIKSWIEDIYGIDLDSIETETEEPKEFTCEDCPYHYYDEGEDYPSCHHTSDDLTAPCEYEEESWGYEDRNYNRLYD